MENELYDQRKWHEQHRTADVILYSKDGRELAALHLSPEGRTRDEHAKYVARLQEWANSLQPSR